MIQSLRRKARRCAEQARKDLFCNVDSVSQDSINLDEFLQSLRERALDLVVAAGIFSRE